MSPLQQTVIFLGNGRCYHTMDWFRSAQVLRPDQPPIFATELIEGESFAKLIRPSDAVERLLVIDRVLFTKQSRVGDIWRNLVKLSLLPIQVHRLRTILKRYPNPVIHAHSMYYIAMARFSGRKYVGTPQGSEVLARPYRSRAYKLFARIALSGASRITVDSAAMQGVLEELYGIRSSLIQNGIDVVAIRGLESTGIRRCNVVSIRGLAPNYQIDRILDARNATAPQVPLCFCYPFSDDGYKRALAPRFTAADRDVGCLSHPDLYRLLLSAKLVVSIPLNDSSPRSVYEAIFCGCIVATTDAKWIAQIPACMRRRLLVVNLAEEDWFRRALEYADTQAGERYIPSAQALELFDQRLSMQKVYDEVYPVVAQS